MALKGAKTPITSPEGAILIEPRATPLVDKFQKLEHRVLTEAQIFRYFVGWVTSFCCPLGRQDGGQEKDFAQWPKIHNIRKCYASVLKKIL